MSTCPRNESASLLTLNTAKSLFSGALAGAVSRTATSPLGMNIMVCMQERLKMIQQVSHLDTSGYNSLCGALRKMYIDEGFLSYWKGNGTNVARIAPHSAITFFCFDFYKSLLLSYSPSKVSNTQYNTAAFLSGALAGVTASTICYPLDLVCVRMAVQTTSKHYTGIGHALKTIFRIDGYRGLYRGLGTTLVGVAPYISLNFATFDLLKRRFLPNRNDPWFDVWNLSLGAFAGATAATCMIYDSGLVDAFVKIHRVEGFRGLYKGLTACYLKVIPSMAISFMTFERCRIWLQFESRK